MFHSPKQTPVTTWPIRCSHTCTTNTCTRDVCQEASCTVISYTMMTSSNGSFFCVTGPLCGEVTGHRWIPLTKASDAELWCFLRSAPWIIGWVISSACALNNRLSKQSWGWWFETTLRSLWRHCSDNWLMYNRTFVQPDIRTTDRCTTDTCKTRQLYNWISVQWVVEKKLTFVHLLCAMIFSLCIYICKSMRTNGHKRLTVQVSIF